MEVYDARTNLGDRRSRRRVRMETHGQLRRKQVMIEEVRKRVDFATDRQTHLWTEEVRGQT